MLRVDFRGLFGRCDGAHAAFLADRMRLAELKHAVDDAASSDEDVDGEGLPPTGFGQGVGHSPDFKIHRRVLPPQTLGRGGLLYFLTGLTSYCREQGGCVLMGVDQESL